MKKFLKLMLTLAVLLPMCFVAVGCDKNKDPETPPAGGGSVAPTPVATIGNFEIRSIRIFHLEEDWYNLEIGVANLGGETAEFDFSKFILKFGESEITHNASIKEYTAGQYFKWSFQIETGQGLSVGQDIDVYYESDLIKTVKIVEF